MEHKLGGLKLTGSSFFGSEVTGRPGGEVIGLSYWLQAAAPGTAGLRVCFSRGLRYLKEYLSGMGDFGPEICRKMSHRSSGIGAGLRIKGLPSWGDAEPGKRM